MARTLQGLREETYLRELEDLVKILRLEEEMDELEERAKRREKVLLESSASMVRSGEVDEIKKGWQTFLVNLDNPPDSKEGEDALYRWWFIYGRR